MRIGQRDVRVTARRLNTVAAGAAYALVLLDDVTERRALEQQVSQNPEPAEKAAPPLSTVEAFDQLGKVLQQEVPLAKPAAKIDKLPEPERKAPPKRQAAQVPDIIRAPIERLDDAVIVAQDGKLLIANTAALKLFGFETANDLVNDPLLWDRFGPLGQSLPASDIAFGGGKSLIATVQMSLIPWQGGPARQFVIRPVTAEKADAVALQVVPIARKVEEPSPPAPKAKSLTGGPNRSPALPR